MGISKAKKVIIGIAILGMTTAIILFALFACENISSEDMTVEDLNKIFDYILEGDSENNDNFSVTQPLTDDISVHTQDISHTEIQLEAESTGNHNIESASEKTESFSDMTSTTQHTSSDMTSGTINETYQPLSKAVKYFPDIADVFKYVPFPDALTMTNSLKQAIKNFDTLAKKSFDGSSFYVATTNPELITPSLGSGTVNDARYYRTNLVETAYDLSLRSIYIESEKAYEQISNSIKSGEYVSDIVCMPLSVQSLFIQNGYLINLKKVPFLNLNAEYYNNSATNAYTVNDEIYCAVSDLVFDPYKIYAVFYNKDLLKNCGLDNLDNMYSNGRWTYDSMLDLCKEMTINIDTAASDLFTVGLSSVNKNVINGMKIPPPFISVSPEATDSFTERIGDVISRIIDNRDGISPLVSDDETSQKSYFSDGKMLFSVATLDLIYDITDSPFDWGILPIPSLDAKLDNQYYSFTSGDALGISVLKGTRNTEKCGIVTEALSLSSHKYMREMYVSELMTYNLRDVFSVNILDSIVNNVIFGKHN